MIATNIRTLKETVILLLKEQGYSPIEALDRWNQVISLDIRNAPPGTHVILIGEYELVYTKSGSVEPAEIEPAPIERGGGSVIVWLLLFGLLALILVTLGLSGGLTVFEDGSWGVGNFPYLINGCLPWGICNL